ncbi:MAG: methylmalonyl Co-A mutase-associated GTPase MeaB [Bryobacterales bacterium]|nr:methylmalonyl Co-A mutase-associated GTPase MeaB [Bryobacterales bacterium]
MQAERILAGDVRALARAATAVENHTAEAEALLAELYPRTGRATIIGVTGPPGVGKSTLVDQLTRALRAEGKTVGILAVDPSSPFSGGAILGDRIRMQQHHADGGVFIRSMATRGQMGGLARGTLEMALLLDAAGREAILIETVGVGQDEVEIARLADVTLVVLVPGMGDDVQAIKAGIMEIADVFAINKSDQAGAERLEQELRAMLLLASDHGRMETPIVKTVASEGKGIGELLAAVRSVKDKKIRNSESLWMARLREMLRERLLERMPAEALRDGAEAVAARRANPYEVVGEWLRRWYPDRG